MERGTHIEHILLVSPPSLWREPELLLLTRMKMKIEIEDRDRDR